MVTFVASPGEEEIDDGKASGVDGETCGEGVTEVVEGDVAAVHSYLGFIDGEEEASGEFAEGVFEGFAEEQKVRSTETVVRVTRQDGLTIEVGAADGGIVVEGNDAACVGYGAGHQETNADGAFEVLRE